MTLLETTNPAAAGGRGEPWISFDTDPGRYRHWKLAIDGPVATLALDTAEDGGLHPGYALKLNSYDLGVDIELHDAVQRLRFEHPEVRAVVLTSAKDGVFCAGANIKMLAQASHPLKVNFCKLTNETRLAIEEASASSGQLYLAAVNGAASGGGYELALATEHILLVDDRIEYPNLTVELDRSLGVATFTLRGPGGDPAAIEALGAGWWPLAVARELDDAILLLRFNEPEIGTWVLRSRGDPEAVAAFDRVLLAHANHWLVREVILHLKRTLKRLELSARSLIALVEPGSCFAGSLLELVLAADRAFMLEGEQEGVDQPPATLRLDPMNLGPLPCSNGLTRLQRRFLGHPEALEAVTARLDEPLEAAEAEALGLVTFIYDDIDFEDEVRLAIEERASLSPDALTGMESNLRCGGPETMETKIFGRLTAWQNWVFQRPNAAGEDGALRRFGTGQRPRFDRKRV